MQVPAFVFDRADGDIFGDGSAFNQSYCVVARAGCAVGQFDECGNELAMIVAPVPRSLPQNAAVAERLAVQIANMHVESGVVGHAYVGDCVGAMKLLNAHASARRPMLPWAGFARLIDCDGLRIDTTGWVKSHQDVESAELSPTSRRDVVCNSCVDQRAKDAALLHPIPDVQIRMHDSMLRHVKSTLRFASNMLALWPPNAD